MRSAAAVACAAFLVAAGCGSQREEAEFRAAYAAAPANEGLGGPSAAAAPSATSAVADPADPASVAAPVASAPVSGVGGGAKAASETPAAGSSGARTTTPEAKPAAGPGQGAGAPAAPGSSAPVPGGAAPAPAPGSKAEIVIGSVGNYSGIPGTFMAPGSRVVQAWVKWANANGGVKGHPVRYIIADDGSDPARHQQLVQEFVERRGVIAFVYNGYPLTGQASVRYLTDKRVPTIGSEGSGQWFNESPMYFAPFAHGHILMEAWLAGAGELLLPQGKKKLGFVACQEVQFCHDAQAVWPGLASKVGFELAYSARVTLAQPSFTAECLGARNAGVDFFYVVSDGNSLHRVARDCKSVGYTPTFGFPSTVIKNEDAADPNVDGLVTTPPFLPWTADGSPELALFRDVVARLAPGTKAEGNPEAGWVSARLFEAAVGRSAAPTSSAGILEGLWALRNETVGGTLPALNFSRDKANPAAQCWSHLVAQGGRLVSPTNNRVSCR
jgi:branched-chain amino acid transport system substrate-binding protein